MSCDSSLLRPDPPIVGKVTHFSIELYWDECMKKTSETANKKDGRLQACLQECDKQNQWGNIYAGYAKKYVITGLDPTSEYKYRLRFSNREKNSDWSAHTVVCTIQEPPTGEHLHRAINRQDADDIEAILDKGDVSVDVNDKLGFTGLMQASQKGYLNVMECLIKHGADINAKNDAGKTSLMLACYAGQLDSVKKLREHDAKYDTVDRGGSTAMHWAVDGGHIKVIEWMIENGADVNLKDHNCGWTPLLRCASVSGNRDVALTLLINGAEIDTQDKDGKTPLMVAILNGHHDLLELLLKKNANLNIKNEFGKTAYDMAVSLEKRRILKTLEEHFQRKGIKTY